MKSVLHFLLDLVYDWDDIESYEYLAPGIDDEPVDVLDIIDDYIDSTDPVELSYSWPSSGGSGLSKGEALAYDLVTWGLETDRKVKSGDIEVPPASVQGIPLWFVMRNYHKYKSFEELQDERVPEPSWSLGALGF